MSKAYHRGIAVKHQIGLSDDAWAIVQSIKTTEEQRTGRKISNSLAIEIAIRGTRYFQGGLTARPSSLRIPTNN